MCPAMIISRATAIKQAVEVAARKRGRAKIRLALEIYDHDAQRYRCVKGGSWTTNVAGDQGEPLDAGISAVIARVEKKL